MCIRDRYILDVVCTTYPQISFLCVLDIVCKPGSPVRHAIYILAHVRRACWQVMTYMPAVRARVRMTECCSLQVMKTAVTASTSRRQCYATTSRQMPPRGSIDAPARQWRPWDPWRPSLLSNTGQKRQNLRLQAPAEWHKMEGVSDFMPLQRLPPALRPRNAGSRGRRAGGSRWSGIKSLTPSILCHSAGACKRRF